MIAATFVYILYVGLITLLIKVNVFGAEPFGWLAPMLYTMGIFPAIFTFLVLEFGKFGKN
jgi:hypothetical protein